MELVLIGVTGSVVVVGVACLGLVVHRHRRPWTTPWTPAPAARAGIRLLESHEVSERVRRAAEQEERLARFASERAARYLALVPDEPGRPGPDRGGDGRATPTRVPALRVVRPSGEARSAG